MLLLKPAYRYRCGERPPGHMGPAMGSDARRPALLLVEARSIRKGAAALHNLSKKRGPSRSSWRGKDEGRSTGKALQALSWGQIFFRAKAKETRQRSEKTTNNTLAIQAAVPSELVKPTKAARIATTSRASGQLNISNPFQVCAVAEPRLVFHLERERLGSEPSNGERPCCTPSASFVSLQFCHKYLSFLPYASARRATAAQCDDRARPRVSKCDFTVFRGFRVHDVPVPSGRVSWGPLAGGREQRWASAE